MLTNSNDWLFLWGSDSILFPGSHHSNDMSAILKWKSFMDR